MLSVRLAPAYSPMAVPLTTGASDGLIVERDCIPYGDGGRVSLSDNHRGSFRDVELG